jgi:MHS family proline/betaine transporter-like MFS transporter
MTQGLTRKQKESVFLLSLGTFLEYFDLMLYIHMAVLLNDLFFPQTDPTVAKILGAFAFGSTFIFRPIGGLIIGRIGDTIGRKKTVVITTFTMAFCCLTMALLPTYAEIGITASVIMIFCRALQGFSSMGEVTGAQLYLVETLKQPYRYICAYIINVQGDLGAFFALAVASFAISSSFDWRLAFWIGAGIALVGLAARTRMRETPEFVDYKRRLKISEVMSNYPLKAQDERFNKKAAIYSLISSFGSIVAYCGAYIFAGDYMEATLGFTPEEVINQNLRVSIVVVAMGLITINFLRKYHPLKIFRLVIVFYALFLPLIPYLLSFGSNLYIMTFLQVMMILPNFSCNCTDMLFMRYFPVTKRFTTSALLNGIANLQFAFIPLLFIPLTGYFGNYGLMVLFIPGLITTFAAMAYLLNMEKRKGLYDNYPDLTVIGTGKANYDFSEPEIYDNYKANCNYSNSLMEHLTDKTKIDLKLVEKAIIFAKKWHDGQMRKSGEPYYSHPLAVAMMVSDYLPNTNAVVAAILHDLIEDSACTRELIEKEFNDRIAQIVYRLTRVRLNEKGERIKLSIAQIVDNLRSLDDKEALLIKELDRLHNLYTIGSVSLDKQKNTVVETLDTIIPSVAYAVDDININDKLRLEEELLENCGEILKKQSSN